MPYGPTADNYEAFLLIHFPIPIKSKLLHYQNTIAPIVGGFVTSQKKTIITVVRGNKSFQQTIVSKDAINPKLKDGIALYV